MSVLVQLSQFTILRIKIQMVSQVKYCSGYIGSTGLQSQFLAEVEQLF